MQSYSARWAMSGSGAAARVVLGIGKAGGVRAFLGGGVGRAVGTGLFI